MGCVGRIAGIAVALWLAAAAPAFAAYAIAFDPSTGRAAAFNGTFDLAEAKREAVSRCSPDCRAVAAGKRYCAAVVWSGRCKPWAVGTGTSTGEAGSKGTFACRSKGGVECRTAAAICE